MKDVVPTGTFDFDEAFWSLCRNVPRKLGKIRQNTNEIFDTAIREIRNDFRMAGDRSIVTDTDARIAERKDEEIVTSPKIFYINIYGGCSSGGDKEISLRARCVHGIDCASATSRYGYQYRKDRTYQQRPLSKAQGVTIYSHRFYETLWNFIYFL